MKEEVRDKVIFLLPVANKSNRAVLDSYNGEKKALIHILHQQYIDEEYKVSLPTNWFNNNTKEKIDAKVFSVGKKWVQLNEEFDVKNINCILLPWTKDNVKNIILETIWKINKVMGDYTKNTGGGSGDDSHVVPWQERDNVAFVNYENKIKYSIYLTVVHMWSRLYNDPFLIIRDNIPAPKNIKSKI